MHISIEGISIGESKMNVYTICIYNVYVNKTTLTFLTKKLLISIIFCNFAI